MIFLYIYAFKFSRCVPNLALQREIPKSDRLGLIGMFISTYYPDVSARLYWPWLWADSSPPVAVNPVCNISLILRPSYLHYNPNKNKKSISDLTPTKLVGELKCEEKSNLYRVVLVSFISRLDFFVLCEQSLQY